MVKAIFQKKYFWNVFCLLCGVFLIGLFLFVGHKDSEATPSDMLTGILFGVIISIFSIVSLFFNLKAYFYIDENHIQSRYHFFGRINCNLSDVVFVLGRNNTLMIQLKDGIGACNCHAKNINIIMPLLYAGRQHRRNTRENLACGASLYELDNMSRVRSLITFDAHDQGVEHAIHNMEFNNFYPTNCILEHLINDLSKNRLKKLVFVAPDNGATGRRNVYLNSFKSKYIHREAGSFVKQRDYNNLVDGKYPVISHDYSGNKNLLVISLLTSPAI